MREHDHIVEPLFGALRQHAADEGARAPVRRARGRVLAGLLVAVAGLLAALALFS